MDMQRAKELLTILADGTDPLTGEVLPDDHVCNKGEIVRALNCAVEALSRKRKKPLPENTGKPWTEELDQELCRLFDEGMRRKTSAHTLPARPAQSSPDCSGWGKCKKCRPTGDQALLRMRYNGSVIKRRRAFL